MIGVGLYVSSFYSLGSLKDARLVLIVWVIGGLHALCGAIAYGAVAKRLPVSGGEYSYLTRCVHPAIGLVAGWVSILAGFAAPIAASSILFAEYLRQILGRTDMGLGVFDARVLATLTIVASALLYVFHLKIGTSFNNGVIAIKMLCFAIFLSVGIPFVLQSGFDGFVKPPATSEGSAEISRDLFVRLQEWDTIHNMIVALFYVSLAYTGFNASIYLAGSIDVGSEDGATRSLVSKSMWMACCLVIVLYVLLNMVFLYGMDASSIVQLDQGYVSVVAKSIGGPWLSTLIQWTIVLSQATSVLAMMATGPMVYAQMAKDGRLPKVFDVSHGATTSRVSVLVQSTLCCLIVWMSKIEEIVGYLGLTLTACGALAVSSIWFARKQLETTIPLRWYEHGATALYIAGAMVLLAFAAGSQPIKLWLCLSTFSVGLIAYALSRLFVKDR
jgi:amino acid transporter